MPKVTIREIDNTGSETLEYLDYTVLVPGLILKDEEGGEILEPRLFTKAEDFKSLVENSIDGGFSKDPSLDNEVYHDKAIIMTYEYLKKGLTVLYAGVYTYDVDKRTKNPKPTRFALQVLKFNEARGITDLNSFFDQFSDKGKYDLRFITIGGIADLYCDEASIAAIRCAGNRGDAVAILSVPKFAFTWPEESGEEVKPYCLDTSEKIDNWVKTTFTSICNENIERAGVSWKDTTETYGRYASIFTPGCVYHTISKFNDVAEDVELPASFMYLTNFAKYINNYPSWFAMSGSIRGVSTYAPVDTKIKLGDKDVDIFQLRTCEMQDENYGHIATNPICEIRPYGNIIWGNRTMHPLSRPDNVASGDLAPQLVASSFLNIRQLCCAIKKQLYRSARQYTFEPNSDVLWINFKKSIEPLLNEMKTNQGIRGYQILKVKTNKKALLVARIRINPIEAVEDFDLTVELTDSIGVTE